MWTCDGYHTSACRQASHQTCYWPSTIPPVQVDLVRSERWFQLSAITRWACSPSHERFLPKKTCRVWSTPGACCSKYRFRPSSLIASQLSASKSDDRTERPAVPIRARRFQVLTAARNSPCIRQQLRICGKPAKSSSKLKKDWCLYKQRHRNHTNPAVRRHNCRE